LNSKSKNTDGSTGAAERQRIKPEKKVDKLRKEKI
jgi:hypothetical protein